jgi:hypothetical protein
MVGLVIQYILKTVGASLPGFGPKTFLTITAALLIGAFGIICFIKGQEGKEAALTRQQLEFAVALQKEKDSNAEELRKAREAGATVPATAPDRAKRLQQCKSSPTCRDRNPGQKRGVRDVPANPVVGG